MDFTRPILLWGLALTLVPIWIHFFGIRPRKTKVIPSLIFLNSLNPSQRSKSKLKDLIVLVLRVLVISFVVLAIAGPTSGSTSSSIQLDNYPAGWTTKESWIKPLIESLEAGNYKVYDREGNFYGQYNKEEVWALSESMPYSVLPFQSVEQALTLSFGYASDIEGTTLLPSREEFSNKEISIQVDALGDYTMEWQGLHQITLTDSNDVLDRSLDSMYTVSADELTRASYMTAEIALDEVLEDNSIAWSNSSSRPRLLLFEGNSTPLGSFASPSDSALTYSSDLYINYALFDAVVVIGFDFLPEQLKDYSGKLLEFQRPSSLSNAVVTQPSLDHPFFSNYFIGPSIQNKWPITRGFKKIDVGASLLSVNHVQVATIEVAHYRQGFMPISWDHPYYVALKQWSLKSKTSTDYLPFLGEDNYSTHAGKERVSILNVNNSGQFPVESLHFHSEKMYLLLALLCALIALIFVKI